MSVLDAASGCMEFVTRSTDQTIELGRRLGALLRAGDVLVLTGDLGAGKTQLTKGIAAGMGVEDDVTSPTFTIQMVYEGDELPLYHFDLYRLDNPDQLDDTGLFDVLGDDGPCVIEWGEQFVDQLGDERLDVFLTRLDEQAAPGEEPARCVRLVPHGERATALVQHLQNGAGLSKKGSPLFARPGRPRPFSASRS